MIKMMATIILDGKSNMDINKIILIMAVNNVARTNRLQHLEL